jgi:hypothetical protein
MKMKRLDVSMHEINFQYNFMIIQRGRVLWKVVEIFFRRRFSTMFLKRVERKRISILVFVTHDVSIVIVVYHDGVTIVMLACHS